jgi:hypothetical protein
VRPPRIGVPTAEVTRYISVSEHITRVLLNTTTHPPVFSRVCYKAKEPPELRSTPLSDLSVDLHPCDVNNPDTSVPGTLDSPP